MIHSKRKHVNKGRSAAKFRSHTGTTHPKNIKPMPRRGGWRL